MDLSLDVAGLRLAHPFILGSGPIGVRADDLVAFGRVAGAIVTKSISAAPSPGSPQPRIVKLPGGGMINYEGGPNPGIDAFCATLREVRADVPCPIIGSVSPRTLARDASLERLAERFVAAGADAFELDFKYVYDMVDGRRDFEPATIARVVERVRTATGRPVIAKLAHGALPLPDLAKAAEDGGAAAISAINTIFPAMRISLKSRRPMLSMGVGGLSGTPVKPIALAAVYVLRQATALPILGIGGIATGADAAEFMLAGANAVEVYTAAQLDGPGLFPRLVEEFAAALAGMGAAGPAEIVGAAQGHAPKTVDRQWDALGLAQDEA
ncbi:dihydroorotate dehydrogenase [Acuticoccus mangrovi]|uniref:Dihydroorotate dehydrogenase catalytic domain-containing protein n=1 Tax=Acuticoccus mangrovi TaxID=2796142 RepID=A0A934IUT2_9HYPH|nr:hypothetical protein [Acuticoccus mangrovi]MBJ3778537.1 hypothetical protein [Acuticoccus mangrovi]